MRNKVDGWFGGKLATCAATLQVTCFFCFSWSTVSLGTRCLNPTMRLIGPRPDQRLAPTRWPLFSQKLTSSRTKRSLCFLSQFLTPLPDVLYWCNDKSRRFQLPHPLLLVITHTHPSFPGLTLLHHTLRFSTVTLTTPHHPRRRSRPPWFPRFLTPLQPQSQWSSPSMRISKIQYMTIHREQTLQKTLTRILRSQRSLPLRPLLTRFWSRQ